MKTILCYGDSNTWGQPPDGGDRYDWSVRWPGILQRHLGSDGRVVEEGLGGRTTCFDDPLCPQRNGLTYLPVSLETHSPIDLLIIMLGANDVKDRFNHSAFTIAQGAGELLSLAKRFEPAIGDVLLVSPPYVVSTDNLEVSLSFTGAIEKSRALAEHYSYFALLHNCHFFDAATVAEISPLDGIHLDKENHKKLGDGIFKEVKKILKVGMD